MNDLSTVPERLRDTAEHVRRQWLTEPGRPLADLLAAAGVTPTDGALIAESMYPGAGEEYLAS